MALPQSRSEYHGMVRGAFDRKMDGERGRTKGNERDKGQGENKSGKEKRFRRGKRPVAGRRSSSVYSVE